MNGFYAESLSSVLRFGDVVIGFPVATPGAHEKGHADRPSTWSIAVSKPQYLSVMTPCCSIEAKSIVLAPLQRIRPGFLKNPYFFEDLTRINRPVPAQSSVPPDAWRHLDEAEKARRLACGEQYVFLDLFIYAPHQSLGSYVLDTRDGPTQSDHYMLDFKTMYRVDCDLINRGSAPPAGMKLLELSIDARQLLRQKTSVFFGRVPLEDQLPE